MCDAVAHAIHDGARRPLAAREPLAASHARRGGERDRFGRRGASPAGHGTAGVARVREL